jgi:phospholipid/cholesterol/gamma-HCH transport system substrate-binding protein
VPSQQQVQWSQLKVGVLVIVALSALAALVFLMSGSTGGFWSGKVILRSYFENSAGVKVGAPVTLEGFTIGDVKSITIAPERKLTPVEVTMTISKKYASVVHQDSKTSLETIGVLGDTVVNIDSKFATGAPVHNGDELKTTESPSLSDVIKSSQGTIEQLNTILAKVDNLVDSLNSGKGSIGQLINDPTLYNKAVLTVNQIQALVDSVSNGKGSIGKLLADDTLYRRVDDTVAHLQHISAQLDEGHGSAGKFLKDEALYNNLKQSTDSLNQLLAGINQGKGAIGMMAKDPAFAKKLDDTVGNLNSVLAQVNSGEGSIGQLLKNPSLFNHADEMLQNTSNLVTAIRQNPKKYLTIHFKVF